MQQRFIIEYGKSLHLNKWIAFFYISCFIFGCSDTQILSPRFKNDPPPNISQSTIKKPPKRPPSPDIQPVSILIPGDVDSQYLIGSGVGFAEPSEKGAFAEGDEVSVGRGLNGEIAPLSGEDATVAALSDGHGFSRGRFVSVGRGADNKWSSSFLLEGGVSFAIPSLDRGFPEEDNFSKEGFISIGRSVRDVDTPSVLEGEAMKVAVLSEGRGFSGEGLDSIGRSVRDTDTSSVLEDEAMKVAVLSEGHGFSGEGLDSIGRSVRDTDTSSVLEDEAMKVAVLSEGRGFSGESFVSVGRSARDIDSSSILQGESVKVAILSEEGGFPEEGLISVGRSVKDADSSSLQGKEMKVVILSEEGGFPEKDLVSGGRGFGDQGSPSFSDDRKAFLSGESVPFSVSSEEGKFSGEDLISVGRSVRDADASSVLEGEAMKVAVLSEGHGFSGEGLVSVGRRLEDQGSPSFSDNKKASLSGELVSFAVSSEEGEFSKEDIVSVGRGLGYKGFPALSDEVVQVAILSEQQEFSEEDFISVGRSVRDEEGGAFPFGQSTPREAVFVDENMALSVSVEEGEQQFIDGETGTFTNGQWANEEQVSFEGSAVTFSIHLAETSFPEGKMVSFISYESVLKTVFFDVDSSELSHDTQKALDQNIRWMRNYPNVRVVLEGHCDPQGSEAYNIKLGQSRAQEVKQYLVEQGISEERLGLVSYGESNPLSYEDNAKNRRVSFFIDPEAQQEKE